MTTEGEASGFIDPGHDLRPGGFGSEGSGHSTDTGNRTSLRDVHPERHVSTSDFVPAGPGDVLLPDARDHGVQVRELILNRKDVYVLVFAKSYREYLDWTVDVNLPKYCPNVRPVIHVSDFRGWSSRNSAVVLLSCPAHQRGVSAVDDYDYLEKLLAIWRHA